MNNKYCILLFSLITIFLLFSSCQKNAGQSDLDDFVFGIHFGMEKEAFFKHCWDLNQEGKTGHGTINNNVMYEDSLNFDELVVVNFYPDFVENKIAKMPMSFYYKGWAPWNKKELTQDKLVKDIIDWMEKKYGPGFKEKDVGKAGTAFYKVVNPLTIRVYKDVFDEMIVRADITHDGYME